MSKNKLNINNSSGVANIEKNNQEKDLKIN